MTYQRLALRDIKECGYYWGLTKDTRGSQYNCWVVIGIRGNPGQLEAVFMSGDVLPLRQLEYGPAFIEFAGPIESPDTPIGISGDISTFLSQS
jgi:hypothetical protein